MALNRVKETINASIPLIWVRTCEYGYYTDKLAAYYRLHSTKKVYTWDTEKGLVDTLHNKPIPDKKEPYDCLDFCCGLTDALCILLDFDKYIDKPEIIRKILNSYEVLGQHKITILCISTDVSVPIELQGYAYMIEAGVASKDMLREVLDQFMETYRIGEYGATTTLYSLATTREHMVTRGVGLTLAEYKNALKLALYNAKQTRKIEYKYIDLVKRERMAELGGVKMLDSDVMFDDLCGLEHLKAFTKTIVQGGKGKGVLLMGVPGSGKTTFATALGNETHRITLDLDFALLQGAHNGETERLTKMALDTVDKLAPCILVIDEIEKGLAGIGDNASTDSGTAKRQGGIFLKWLNDHKTDVYVVATANDIRYLPPEYLRAERWDTLFYIDIPNKKQQTSLLELYTKKYGIPPQEYPNTTRWTGAEIKTLCRLANSLNISLVEAKDYINPICNSMPVKIREIQILGQKMCLDASERTPYDYYEE